MNAITIPPGLSNFPREHLLPPRPLLIKPAAAPAPAYRDHFLSVIAFDGNITLQTTQSIMLAQREKVPLWRGWKFHMGEGQGRSRNECAHIFLTQSDCEYHDLLDADIMFHPAHWRALRRHPAAKDAIICGAYPKKQDKIEFCYNPLKTGPFEPDATGCMEIAKGGTGFMQIPRSVYLRVQEAFPELWYQCDYEHDAQGVGLRKFGFFCEKIMHDEDVGFVRHLTEDWMFCHLARRAGVKIYIDFTTTQQPWVQHRGTALYPLPVELERARLEHELEQAQARIAALEKTPA